MKRQRQLTQRHTSPNTWITNCQLLRNDILPIMKTWRPVGKMRIFNILRVLSRNYFVFWIFLVHRQQESVVSLLCISLDQIFLQTKCPLHGTSQKANPDRIMYMRSLWISLSHLASWVVIGILGFVKRVPSCISSILLPWDSADWIARWCHN